MSAVYLTGGPLLNFYMRGMVWPHPVTGKPVKWPSVEHYFQACKALFLRVPFPPLAPRKYVDEIRKAETPSEAKALGRHLVIQVPMWDRAAVGFMLQGHIAKFSHHADLREKLLTTGSARIVEHRPDPLWGDSMDDTGKNLCGKSLMQVRRMAKGWET